MKSPDCEQLYRDADFYDLEFSGRSDDIPFYCARARESGGPVLEIGCGTGRLTLPIAREGIEIVGLDASNAMLQKARQKATVERAVVEWIEEDCREMCFERRFELVFVATNTMQHLVDLESICRFLQGAMRALRPGGRLIIDVFHPDPARLVRPKTVRYPKKSFRDSEGSIVRVEAASEYHASTQVLEFTYYYIRDETQILTKEVSMRCFFPVELLVLCQLNGLEVVRRFGDYDEQPFAGTSPKQILVCRPMNR